MPGGGAGLVPHANPELDDEDANVDEVEDVDDVDADEDVDVADDDAVDDDDADVACRAPPVPIWLPPPSPTAGVGPVVAEQA